MPRRRARRIPIAIGILRLQPSGPGQHTKVPTLARSQKTSTSHSRGDQRFSRPPRADVDLAWLSQIIGIDAGRRAVFAPVGRDARTRRFLTMRVAVEQRLENVNDDAVREAEEARAIRAQRDANLTPEERLQRTAELCRQLALIRPVDQT